MWNIILKCVHGVAFILICIILYYAVWFLIRIDALWNEWVFQPFFGVEIPFLGCIVTVLVLYGIGSFRDIVARTPVYKWLRKRLPIATVLLFGQKTGKMSPILKGCVFVRYHYEKHVKAITSTSFFRIRDGSSVNCNITVSAMPSSEGFTGDVLVLAKRVTTGTGVRHDPFPLVVGILWELGGVLLSEDVLQDAEWVPYEKFARDQGYI